MINTGQMFDSEDRILKKLWYDQTLNICLLYVVINNSEKW